MVMGGVTKLASCHPSLPGKCPHGNAKTLCNSMNLPSWLVTYCIIVLQKVEVSHETSSTGMRTLWSVYSTPMLLWSICINVHNIPPTTLSLACTRVHTHTQAVSHHVSVSESEDGEVELEEHPSTTWISAIARGTVDKYVMNILKIPRLTERATQQLAIDIGTFANRCSNSACV